jgi:hypothetical protein
LFNSVAYIPLQAGLGSHRYSLVLVDRMSLRNMF